VSPNDLGVRELDAQWTLAGGEPPERGRYRSRTRARQGSELSLASLEAVLAARCSDPAVLPEDVGEISQVIGLAFGQHAVSHCGLAWARGRAAAPAAPRPAPRCYAGPRSDRIHCGARGSRRAALPSFIVESLFPESGSGEAR
jgi:hypothetical protein